MTPSQTPVQLLADLLQNHARPVIRPERLAPALTYDLDYRMTVVALAFHSHAKEESDGVRRLDASRLKLLQFVAQRPALLSTLQRWASSRKDTDFIQGSSQRLRRGYMGDSMHNQVISFMIAREILRWEGKFLAYGARGTFIDALHDEALREDIFSSERNVLSLLKMVRITNAMLEGE